MRSFALVFIGALLAACAKTETSIPADTGTTAMAPAPEPAAAPAAAPIDLKSVAGKYRITSRAQAPDPDTIVVTSELNATGDTTGWTITYPNRAPVPMRIVSVSGDSIVAEAGPFSSVRRAGVPVTTRTTYRLQNGRLVGTAVSRYDVKGPDTMRVFVIEGVKK